MLDLMAFGSEHFVVTRIPLRDEDGTLVGALGFVLFDRARHLKPLMAKFNLLQNQLVATQHELAKARRARYTIAGFIGSSTAAAEVKRLARRAAQLDATVLLRGETGTGKELLAQGIHNLSPRANGPFVAVNVAAIPETLVEAELFGTAPGAFTGADRKGRIGKFEVANGGTLFLDEIGDLPLALQAKLLRVLQEQEVEPLGSNQVKPLNVRVIAATHIDLEAKVAAGQFRDDLYYRLNVLALQVPPLRERREDIPALVEHLLDDIANRSGQAPMELSPAALALLCAQPWKGNVRELRNLLERAQLDADGPLLEAAQLQPLLAAAGLPAPALPAEPLAASPIEAAPLRPLAESIAEAERRALQQALAACNGNRRRTATELGISRASLYSKLQQHGLSAR
jgi:transcriptional regulator with PAS, ATPase and Fis domain